MKLKKMISKKNPFDSEYYKSSDLKKFGFKKVGKNVTIAKNCTIIGLNNISLGNNIRIDSNVVIAARSGVTKNIDNNSAIAGFPAVEINKWKKSIIRQYKEFK